MEVYTRKINIIFFLIISLMPGKVMSNSDDYMKMLESEAANTTVDSRGIGKAGQRNKSRLAEDMPVNKAAAGDRKVSKECNYSDDVLPAGMIREEFSSYLKQCAMSTYAYFRRLEMKSQYSVYESYKNTVTVNLRVLRKEILKYY